MALVHIIVKRRGEPNTIATVVLTPNSLDLDPSESGAVAVSAVDRLGRPVAVTVQSVAAPTGLTASVSGTTVTITADAVGPLVDETLTVDAEVV